MSVSYTHLINKMSDTEIVDGARDFRLMTRQMVDAILSMGEYNHVYKRQPQGFPQRRSLSSNQRDAE